MVITFSDLHKFVFGMSMIYLKFNQHTFVNFQQVLNPKRPVIFINTGMFCFSLSFPLYLMNYVLILVEQFINFSSNSDLLPTYETTDHKAVNNPIEAYIIAEV